MPKSLPESRSGAVRFSSSKFSQRRIQSKSKLKCIKVKQPLSIHDQLTRVMMKKLSSTAFKVTAPKKSGKSRKKPRKSKKVSFDSSLSSSDPEPETPSQTITPAIIPAAVKSIEHLSLKNLKEQSEMSKKQKEKEPKFYKTTISVTKNDSKFLGKIDLVKGLVRRIPSLLIVPRISNTYREYLLEGNLIFLSLLAVFLMAELCCIFWFFVFFNWYVELLNKGMMLYHLLCAMMVILVGLVVCTAAAIFISRKSQYVHYFPGNCFFEYFFGRTH